VLCVPVQMVIELIHRLAGEIADGRLTVGVALPSVRALARQAGCSAGSAARAYAELRRAGLIVTRDRARARVAEGAPARARALLAGRGALRLAGSDDPALDALLRAVGGDVTLAAGPRGSVSGLELMARGAADAATVHLLHAASGRYNDPFVRRLLGSEPVVLVHLWRREQGLLVAGGNPLGIRGVADLAGRRLAWRAPGTASRLALERLLREAGAEPQPEAGGPAASHLAVAASVAAGAADAGLAVRSAASACEVDFVPVAVEPFELAVRERTLDAAAPLLDGLAAAVAGLPGYDPSEAGEIRRPA
jgi:molybdate-binding protein